MRNVLKPLKVSAFFASSLTIVICLLTSVTAYGAIEKLLQTDKSWDGGDFSYPKGQAEITSIKILLKEGEQTPYHCHPVPTLGYIAKGNVEVETLQGKKVILKEGESAVEVMNTWHRGKAVSGDLEIVVFYAGEKGLGNTVKFTDGKTPDSPCVPD